MVLMLWRSARSALVVTAFFALSLNGQPPSAYALTGDPSVAAPPADMQFYQWALTQGGLTAVTLFVLWSYRRDFDRMLKKEEEKTSILTELVGDTTAALQKSASATEALERADTRLASAVERLELVLQVQQKGVVRP